MQLKVAIDGRLRAGESGGLQQMVIGLTAGLGAIADPDEVYRVLVPQDDHAWIEPYMTERITTIPVPTDPGQGRMRQLDRALGRISPARTAVHRIAPRIGNLATRVPSSDGTVEGLGADVVHFPLQAAFRTQIPSIYQPHDLQHVHLPQYFTPLQRRVRDRRFRELCDQATTVVAMTRWGRGDLVRHLGLPAGKIAVVPGASVLSFYPRPTEADRADVVRRFELPDRFALYPAQTWPHKNHIRLLDALAQLRERGVRVPLVLVGRMNEHSSDITKRIEQLRLHDQVRLTGFVSPLEVRALYELAACLVFPSLFEGWGMPVVEAFESGVPVAASNIPVIAEVAGGAALLFDPNDPVSIATALERTWTDGDVRAELIRKGTDRASLFMWQETARRFRALYRAAIRRDETGDAALLQEVFS
jgi:glycosyltransferase involved in cell wall biosynthesis